MGLFGNLFDKKECAFCGGEIGLLGNRKLEDGNMCKECAGKLSPWFFDHKHSTVAEIGEQLKYREANKQEVAAFRATRVFGECWELRIDDNQGKFMIVRTKDVDAENPDVVQLAQVVGSELDVDESRYEDTYRNRDGESVGYDPPRYGYNYDFDIVIRVNHPYFDDMRFRLNRDSVEVIPLGQEGGAYGTGFSAERRPAEYQKYEAMGMQIKDALLRANAGQPAVGVQQGGYPMPGQGGFQQPQQQGAFQAGGFPAVAASGAPQTAAAASGAVAGMAGVSAPAGFCQNCGVPLTGGRFCESCGSPAA